MTSRVLSTGVSEISVWGIPSFALRELAGYKRAHTTEQILSCNLRSQASRSPAFNLSRRFRV